MISFSRAKYKQAQLQVAMATKSIDNVKLIFQKKITSGDIIRGCCMSIHGDCFFTDHYKKKRLIAISFSGTLKYNMSLDPSDGFDIIFINEKTVAITSGNSRVNTGIDIINSESRSKIKFIKLPNCPYGITRDGDSLFVCVLRHGIYKVNTLDDTTSLVISQSSIDYNSYVSVFTDKIYYTDGNSVVCCDRNGSRVWTFKYNSILKKPSGITVNNDGNVYVVGERSCNVVIISNNGKQHKEILTKTDGLNEPSPIFLINRTGNFLLQILRKRCFFTM
ncbi:unnamed protein product [Mytilus coruscus]|uniref:RING-type E3 ubiquitin transferase n=1 Tax=Mytilus coruscus TaxID=42192 RepID=A0A6J8CCD4_MYTCO|nr:unnamed protein product [Mytilus coruscus]